MSNKEPSRFAALLLLYVFLILTTGWSQSINATLSGTVTDPSGAVLPGAKLTLTAVATGAVAVTTSNSEGLYAFPNLQAGDYELRISISGFRDYTRRGISLRIGDSARLNVKLELGVESQSIEVSSNASPLNFENAELKSGIAPDTLSKLPLLAAGGPRSAFQFVVLMPGVTTSGPPDASFARTAGGQQFEGEMIVDGASLQEGNGMNGFLAGFDFPESPDMISEIKVITSNYEPQYGSAAAGTVIVDSKSGTNEFHGSLFEYHRDTALNAREFGRDAKSKDIENEFGGNIGGPARIPFLWGSRHRTYFFVHYESFRTAGALSTPVLSIPSLKERNGDFSDWVDSNGNLIPVYDPATTRPNPAFDSNQPVGSSNLPFLRNQFMGCDGRSPNVICPSDPRLGNSLAKQWFRFLPEPTFSGPLNNYRVPNPVSNTITGNLNFLRVRVDEYLGDKDHFSVSVYHRKNVPYFASNLPAQISSDFLQLGTYTFADRLNWEHTFSPTFLNHLTLAYTDFTESEPDADAAFVNEIPKIPGVTSHNYPPQINFSNGFSTLGGQRGREQDVFTRRPVAIVNDLFTWVKGKHTLKFGGEYRWLAFNAHGRQNESGTFNFLSTETGLKGINSGNPVASFLLEQVDSASVSSHGYGVSYPRQAAWSFHIGDTWKVTPKLSLAYGLRWDLSRPSVEKFDRMSFFDPLSANPRAGGRLGRLAFAGSNWGPASFGRRHPEETFKKAFAPRLGIAYTLTPRTVLRTGYGIYYGPASYPSWGDGVATDGFDSAVSFSSPDGGLSPALILSQGFPEIPSTLRPPFVDSGFSNGQFPTFRPFDANRLPYSQQWNLSLEREFTNDFFVSAAYVGSKGTRLLSRVAPLNALDPKYLSLGSKLFDTFGPSDATLHGFPLPYPGWVDQMVGCAPSLAQALLAYPQYCGSLQGLNENAGNSTFHSFQLKAERRFSGGL